MEAEGRQACLRQAGAAAEHRKDFGVKKSTLSGETERQQAQHNRYNMRIIAGQYKGRKIDFPRHIRPTQDKVRQAVFDVLGGAVEGCRVLDLFAGSGAFGLEAASRGARAVCFIDRDRRSSAVVEVNIKKLGLDSEKDIEVENHVQDAVRAIGILAKRKKLFDLVFLDPPYGSDALKKSLKTLGESDILTPRSFVIAEHVKRSSMPETEGLLLQFRQIEHGDTAVTFYARGWTKRPRRKAPREDVAVIG